MKMILEIDAVRRSGADADERRQSTDPADLVAAAAFLLDVAEAEVLGPRGADYGMDRFRLEVTW